MWPFRFSNSTSKRLFRKKKLILKLLCITNLILLLALIKTFFDKKFYGQAYYDAFKDSNEIFTVEKYRQLMVRSMEIFDYTKKLNAHLIPIQTVVEKNPISIPWCWPWNYPIKPKKKVPNLASEPQLWQSLIDEQNELYFYSAFMDDRFDERTPDASVFVRIVGMGWRHLKNVKLFCYLWFSEGKSFLVEATIKLIWKRYLDPRDSFYFPFLYSCPIPRRIVSTNGLPLNVSLSFISCPTTLDVLLPINQYKLKSHGLKNHTVVCVKGLDFLDDQSQRLVEWLEANYLMGASKIMMYAYKVHPKMKKVLNFYTKKFSTEIFQVMPLTSPGRTPNADQQALSDYFHRNKQQKRRHELVPYNDCFYRHLYSHKYVLLVDLDEILVPLETYQNWSHVLDDLEKMYVKTTRQTIVTFSVTNAFFFYNLTDVQNSSSSKFGSNLHFLNHKIRSKQLSSKGVYSKSFMSTLNALTVFNHYVMHKLKSDKFLMPTFHVPRNMIQKNHYRNGCPSELSKACNGLLNDVIVDKSLHRFESDLIKNVIDVLQALKE